MCSSNKHYLLKWFFGNQVLFKNVRYCTSVMFSKFFFYYYYLMYTTVQMFAVHEKIFNDGIYFSVIVVCELNWKAFFLQHAEMISVLLLQYKTILLKFNCRFSFQNNRLLFTPFLCKCNMFNVLLSIKMALK